MKILLIFLVLSTPAIADFGKMEIFTIHSKALEQSIFKVETEKHLVVYLPPSYAKSKKNYPVVYFLPGYTSYVYTYIHGQYGDFMLKESLDRLITEKKIKEMIFVIVDGDNFIGGSFYNNSPLTGNFEDFVVQEAVSYIDNNYRTIQNKNNRAIAGNSMGGYGALTIGMKYPDIFSIVYALSPGVFTKTGLHDMELFTQSQLDFIKSFASNLTTLQKQKNTAIALDKLKNSIDPLFEESRDRYYSAFTLAYGSAFAYDKSLPFPHIAFPSEATTAKNLQKQSFQPWLSGFGQWQNKLLKYKNNINKLNYLAIDCGEKDKWITKGSKYLIDLMHSQDIKVDGLWHDGGHLDKMPERIEEFMLPHISNNFFME